MSPVLEVLLYISRLYFINEQYLEPILDIQICEILDRNDIFFHSGVISMEFNTTGRPQCFKLLLVEVHKYISKFMTLIVICGNNFPNFCSIDVFSLEMDSLNNEDNFVGQVTELADI